MGHDNIKEKVVSSLFWKLIERVGNQGAQFIIQIILARILLPKDYGLIALATIFITIANIFVQSSFSTALIQKKNADEIDFSSALYLNLLVAGILYIIFFFTAPQIAAFFKEPLLIPIFRVISIVLIIGAINSVQNALLARKMHFKRLFFSSLGAIIVSGTTSIIIACMGFGVWALVAQQLINQLMITVILGFTVKWRPKLIISHDKVKALFIYGWKLLAAALIETLFSNLRSIIIGKIYNSEMLGFYNRGQQFPLIIVSNIDGSIQSVMLPALSYQQDNKQRVKEMMRRSIVTSAFVLFPMMIGLTVIAEPLVKLVLTDKWLACVPFLQIYCISYILWPIHTANLQAINAIGRSDIFLKLEIIKKAVGLGILWITIFYGIYAIAFGEILIGIISSIINAYPNQALLNYSYKEQLRDIMPSLLLSLIMGVVVYCILLLALPTLITIILQIFVGVFLYIGLAKIFKLESFTYLYLTLKELLKSRGAK